MLNDNLPGYWPVAIRRPGISVVLVLQVHIEEERSVCGLRFLVGTIRLPPKALRRAIIEELSKVEAEAKAAGFHEMRHAGDDWSALLPGYEPMPGLRNGLRKRL